MNVDLIKLRIAAIFGFLAVGLGAMGAHGLKSKWESQFDAAQVAKLLELWKTASLYHIVHAVLLVVLAVLFHVRGQRRFTFGSFVLGMILFSGSLYAYALTGVKFFAHTTPIGGVFLMIGWLMLVFTAAKHLKENR